VTGGADEGDIVESAAVHGDLALEPRQRVALALDLESGQTAVDNQNVYAALTETQIALTGDQRVRLGILPTE
jgi:hypothetical protein